MRHHTLNIRANWKSYSIVVKVCFFNLTQRAKKSTTQKNCCISVIELDIIAFWSVSKYAVDVVFLQWAKRVHLVTTIVKSSIRKRFIAAWSWLNKEVVINSVCILVIRVELLCVAHIALKITQDTCEMIPIIE